MVVYIGKHFIRQEQMNLILANYEQANTTLKNMIELLLAHVFPYLILASLYR